MVQWKMPITKDHILYDYIHRKCPVIGKSKETEGGLVVARGCAEEGLGSGWYGDKFLWGWWKYLNLESGYDCIVLWLYCKTTNCTLYKQVDHFLVSTCSWENSGIVLQKWLYSLSIMKTAHLCLCRIVICFMVHIDYSVNPSEFPSNTRESLCLLLSEPNQPKTTRDKPAVWQSQVYCLIHTVESLWSFSTNKGES